MRCLSRALLAVSIAASLAVPAAAQDPAAFYKGRNVDIIVASPPGGGFDAYARILARHMVRYMPAPPSFIIKNLAGAGGRNATTFLADVAPRDGSVILANQPGALVEQILGDAKSVFYDPLKFQYIGSLESFTALCLLRTDAEVKSYAELQQKPAIFGGDQIGSTTYDHTLMFKNLAGAKIKFVGGYKGTADLVLAIKRKEIEGFCGYAWSSLFSRSPDLVDDRIVRIILQLGLTPHPEATKAGVPIVWDFVTDETNRKAIELIATVQEFGRPFLVHGAVPADRVAALRAAFDATVKDKDYSAEIAKQQLDNSPITGQKVEELLRKVHSAPKEVQAKARWGISTE